MANNLLVDPMYLDSAGSGIGASRQYVIKSVEWVKPVAVGDRAYFLDKDGATVCDFLCDVANKRQIKYFGDRGHPFTGPFNLSTLDSGQLLIQLF